MVKAIDNLQMGKQINSLCTEEWLNFPVVAVVVQSNQLNCRIPYPWKSVPENSTYMHMFQDLPIYFAIYLYTYKKIKENKFVPTAYAYLPFIVYFGKSWEDLSDMVLLFYNSCETLVMLQLTSLLSYFP